MSIPTQGLLIKETARENKAARSPDTDRKLCAPRLNIQEERHGDATNQRAAPTCRSPSYSEQTAPYLLIVMRSKPGSKSLQSAVCSSEQLQCLALFSAPEPQPEPQAQLNTHARALGPNRHHGRLRETTPLIPDANTTSVEALKREHPPGHCSHVLNKFLKPSHIKLFMSMVDQRATQLAGKKQSKKILKTRRKKSVRN